MSSSESDPSMRKKFMPRWAVAGLSAVAFAGVLAGCAEDQKAYRTYVYIPHGAQQLGMNYVGVPGLKFEVPADREKQVDCGYRPYFEDPLDRTGSPEYIPNTKGVDRSNPAFPIVVCQGTSPDFTVAQPRN